MASFASTNNERIHTYKGEDVDPLSYISERVKIRGSKPRVNARDCYIRSGGGIPSKGDSSSNMGRMRAREREKIDVMNMRTHDRLMKVTSSIPKQRTTQKVTKVNKRTGEKVNVNKQIPSSQRKEFRERKERREIAENNRKMTKHLNDIYKGSARLAEHGVMAKDCRSIWKKRTNLYADKPDRRRCETGVPKTAGVVACGGCGLKTFFGADGLTVHQGTHGNMDPATNVYYCNDVCAAVDWEINRENINSQDAGGKGRKPMRRANYWVQSRAAVVARKMLRRAVENNELPDLDGILREIKIQRGVGDRQSEAIARTLPGPEHDNAEGGNVDRQKSHIREGAVYSLEEYQRAEPDVWFGKEPPKGTVKEQIARERRERNNADQQEINRILREGQHGKGSIDKNMPSQEDTSEKPPNPNKYRGKSNVKIGGGDAEVYGNKKEMYRTTKDIERERDRMAQKQHAIGQKIANRGKKSKRLMENRRELEEFNATEEMRKDEERARSGRRPKEVYRDPDGFEIRKRLGGLEYDGTRATRNVERDGIKEPKVSVVTKDEDPKLFRQSMDMLRLKR